MITTLVVLVIVLLFAAGGISYFIERARQQELPGRSHRLLDLRTLPEQRVRDYRAEWVAAQARFVDDPDGAVRAADTLVERLMAERGYPPADADLGGLGAEQAEVLQHYLAAHELTAGAGDTDTDALRRAMVHYRMVFSSVLESGVRQHAK